MGQSIDENERECIRIASNVLEKAQRNSIEPLGTKVINYFSNSFAGDAGISKVIGLAIYLLIQLPIAILFTPLGIPFLIWLHIDEHRLARRIGKRYLTYSKPEPRHIFLLWDKYGLNDIYDDDILSNVASQWIKLLYSKDFHIEANEIKKSFTLKAVEQSQLYNDYLSRGIHTQLKNWRHIVLSDIFESLPIYDE